MKARSRYRKDGAQAYEAVESGLNRMTLAKFERLIERSGLRVVDRHCRAVNGLSVLAQIPALREPFVTHVSVVLARAESARG
jgi:hypothetical protein